MKLLALGVLLAVSLAVSLGKEPTLNVCEFHGHGAFFVVVSHVVDPRAYGIAAHQPGVAGLQQIGRRARVPHPRIEPQVVGVRIKNDGHPVVDGRGHNNCVQK